MPVFKRLLTLVLVLALLAPAACAQAEAMNILLIGVDTPSGEQSGRSDTMILVRADPQEGSLRMLSFLRDLYVQIPGVGRTRLNAAYRHGGEALLKQTLHEQFGVTADRTVTVHFDMLEELVDALGGIELTLSSQECSHLNAMLKSEGIGQRLSEGTQRLNGRQALFYSRLRKLDSDFQRTSRQQAVIAAMLKSASQMDAWNLMALALRTLPEIETDLGLGDLLTLVPMAANLNDLSFHTARVPFDGTYRDETIDGMMVLTPNLEQNRALIRDFMNGN